MKEKDPNYAIKVEQAIAKKYGEDTVVHPKSQWDDEKEKKYLDELKEMYYNNIDKEDLDKEEVNGVFIPKKLLREESNRSCSTCNTYSFKSKDDVYMTKFGCCFKCYIQYVEGREDRWKNGWRPNK
jgi:hypothetical protein|tara:strand:- start:351 stop:728 length:378 start_codon:yes stop_codon:yes gene_type:complete